MTPQQMAANALRHGNEFPYDAPDDYERGSESPPVDWAHSAARGVLTDLTDRRGIKRGFEDLDHEVRADIVASLAEIIRAALGDLSDPNAQWMSRALAAEAIVSKVRAVVAEKS